MNLTIPDKKLINSKHPSQLYYATVTHYTAAYHGVSGQACCGVMTAVGCLEVSSLPTSRQPQAWHLTVSRWADTRLAEPGSQRSKHAAAACRTMQLSPVAWTLTDLLGRCNGVPRPMLDHGQPRQNQAPTAWSTQQSTNRLHQLAPTLPQNLVGAKFYCHIKTHPCWL